MPLPSNPEAYLSTKQASEFLGEHGFYVHWTDLTTRRTRGGGPAFRKWGRHILYARSDLLDWAKSRLSAPAASTAELRRLKREAEQAA